MTELSPDLLLKAYACGVFPMAETRDSKELFWVDPKRRGILPLDEFHLPRRLAKTVKRGVFRVSINTAFEDVMRGCAATQPTRPDTWINESILKHYGHLHRLGHAHSVECWLKNKLVGGLYGVSLGGAFFGESMFHTITDASKVALTHLVARLKAGGYTLLDTQFVTEHLQQFGAREIDRELYHKMLDTALMRQADFYSLPPGLSGEAVLQSITQMS